MNNPDYFNTVSLTELYDTVYPPKTQVIDNLLYAGVYLFAGAPKVGKSFFMAQIGYHVSKGIPLWNYAVHKAFPHLALEDDYARLQKRLSKMFGMDGTDDFHFVTNAKNLSQGLESQLDTFIQEHPDTRLIIVDTLQKSVKPVVKSLAMPVIMKSWQSLNSLMQSIMFVFFLYTTPESKTQMIALIQYPVRMGY